MYIYGSVRAVKFEKLSQPLSDVDGIHILFNQRTPSTIPNLIIP
jgi:hypothetical protein